MGKHSSDWEFVVKYTERQENMRKVWSDVKLAVRAYAREPSEVNAEKVTIVWERVKQLKGNTLRAGPRPQNR